MSSPDRYPVYLGLWTNWSRGAVMGSTLTLSPADGNLLIAFVAFFVAWVGTRLWRIICLILHFAYSNPNSNDALYHQRQVILRNSATPESGLLTLAYLAFAWSRNKLPTRYYLRLIVVITISFLLVVGFTAASGFSSQVSVAMSNEVLVSGTHCAVMDDDLFWSIPDELRTRYLEPYESRKSNNWANYVRLCYMSGEDISTRPECRQYVQSRLPSVIQTNASCPFNATLCKSQNQNLIIDTGYLDSHEHFGINAPPEKRFQYRRVTRCAPLTTERYSFPFNRSADRPYKRYYYGPSQLANLRANHTYEHPDDARQEMSYSKMTGAFPDYSIGFSAASYGKGKMIPYQTNFIPITEFETSTMDADLRLFFLSANHIGYTQPANDSWYHATTRAGNTAVFEDADTKILVNGTTIYIRDEAASPLACKVQEQLCNPNLPQDSRCGPLATAYDFPYAAANTVFVNYTDIVQGLSWTFSGSFGVTGYLHDAPIGLGSHSLTSRSSLNSGIQGYLPDNQWMLDVEYWHNIAMTSLQGSLVNSAAGPGLSDPTVLPWYSKKPNTTIESNICHSQKIISTAYTSFSVFGILFIFVFGTIIVLVSFILDPIMVCLRQRYKIKQYQQLEWQTHDALQLHRLAHEAIGAGTWSGAADNIPVTLIGEKLALLDISNPEHPKLRAPISQQGRLQGKDVSVVHDTELRCPGDESEGLGISPTDSTWSPTSTTARSRGETFVVSESHRDYDRPQNDLVDENNVEVSPPREVVVLEAESPLEERHGV